MSNCKYYKQKKQVSYNSGQTWSDVSPAVYQVGNLYEMDSMDCSHGSSQIRWVIVPGDFLCEGKNKYEKEIEQYSTDGGNTWRNVYPTTFRKGRLIETNSAICDYKWEGHYFDTDDSGVEDPCGAGYRWVDGVGCVYVDPIKIVRCTSSSETLTNTDTTYRPYALFSGTIGGCVTSIDDWAFSHEYLDGTPYNTELTSVTIPNSVVSIGKGAFYGCSGIPSITIPSGVRSIGEYAFSNCSSLTGITIPSGITSISRYTFSSCNSLSYVNFGNITVIGEMAFFGCSALTSVNIPDSVTEIGNEAFYVCPSITSVTIGSGVTSIGAWVFGGSTGLTGITIHATIPPHIAGGTFWDTNNCPLYVPCDSLISYKREWAALYDRIYPIPPCETPPVPTNYKLYETYSGETYYLVECDSATTLTSGETGSYSDSRDKIVAASIGNCVTSIGSNAFTRCTSLTSMTIPDSVVTIGGGAFWYCSGLTNVTIGSGVTGIGNYAFEYCSGLASITCLSATPPTLGGNDVFKYTNDCTIYVPCDSLIAYKNADKWNSIRLRIQGIPPCGITMKLTAKYYWGQSNEVVCNSSPILTRNEITSFTTTVTSMTEAIIGDCVTSIGESAFSGCTILSSVTIPDSVTSIGMEAFYNCYRLTSISIPNSVTSIDNSAFQSCSGLTSISIPNSVTSIGDNTFKRCTSLSSVTIGSGITAIGNNTFNDCTSLTSIGVVGSGASVEIPSSVTSIGTWAFGNCTSLSSVTIPDSVTSIGDYTFFYCFRLTSVTIPDSVTSIGGSAFSNCGSLSSVTIPDSVTSIGSSAFFYSTGLTSCIIGSGVTSISSNVFYECYSLSSITIPDSVTSIGGGAFYNCSGLTSVIIPSGVTSIGPSAFDSCSSLTSITCLSATPPTLGSNVFDHTNNCPIYVSAASLSDYQTAWSYYASRLQVLQI